MSIPDHLNPYIVSEFSRIGFKTPRVAWDEKILEKQKNIEKQSQYKTYILVGLYSNAIVNEFVNSEVIQNTNTDVKPLFTISREDDDEGGKVTNTLFWERFPSQNHNRDSSSSPIDRKVVWLIRESKILDDYDYGVFGKFIHDEKIYIICGATSELGTNKLSKHVAENWEEAYFELILKKGSELLPDDPFVVIYKIPVADQNEEIILFDWCIRPSIVS